MNCPACNNVLQQMTAGNVNVDVCKGGCGGVWFDQLEVKKFDEPHEAAGEIILEAQRDKNITVDRSERSKCPKCDDMIMMRHFFSIKRQVEVDECPQCGGFWLDAGELALIRDQYSTEEERHDAAKSYFEDIFKDEFEALKKESEEKTAAAKKISKMFKFLCPSYYIPGKQDWGAF